MNKKIVNDWLPVAIRALEHTGIANADGQILKTCRNHISIFGTAVVMGSLKSAIAFFSGETKSEVDRESLLRAMYYVIHDMKSANDLANVDGKKIFAWVCGNDSRETRE